MIFYLIYFSKATKILTDPEIEDLLKMSRKWNADHQLTGLLVYIEGDSNNQIEGRFMQILEGTQYNIEEIFLSIKQDSRHYDVVLLKRACSEKRSFNNWDLKFERLSLTACPDMKEFFEMDEDILTSDTIINSDMALNFLKSF